MTTSITVSVPRPAPWFTPVFVAIDKGFFAEQGIQATLQFGADPQRLLRGDTDFMVTGAGRGGFLTELGIRMVCGHSTRDTGHVLMVRPQVGTADRLRHVIAGGRLDDELQSVLGQYGLDLAESGIVTIETPKGGHPEQYRLLKENIGDGAMIGPPWWIFLSKEGYLNLGGEGDYRPDASGSGVFVSPEKIAKEPDLVRAFVHAYVKAIRYCRENEENTLETMVKYSQNWGVTTPEIAKEVYAIVEPFWQPEIDVPTIQRLLKRTAERTGVAPVGVESFLDLRFLNEALAGFGGGSPGTPR